MKPTTEDLIQKLESASNFCLGMAMDPAVPEHAKGALRAHAASIDAMVEAALAEPDFLADAQACDLSGEGTCEACQ